MEECDGKDVDFHEKRGRTRNFEGWVLRILDVSFLWKKHRFSSDPSPEDARPNLEIGRTEKKIGEIIMMRAAGNKKTKQQQ